MTTALVATMTLYAQIRFILQVRPRSTIWNHYQSKVSKQKAKKVDVLMVTHREDSG